MGASGGGSAGEGGRVSATCESSGGPARLREERAAELERERAAFMSSNVSKVHRSADLASAKEPLRGRKFRKETPDADFVSTARIVEELGASRFEGKDKKKWELKRLKAMGAKAPKNEKVPTFTTLWGWEGGWVGVCVCERVYNICNISGPHLHPQGDACQSY